MYTVIHFNIIYSRKISKNILFVIYKIVHTFWIKPELSYRYKSVIYIRILLQEKHIHIITLQTILKFELFNTIIKYN